MEPEKRMAILEAARSLTTLEHDYDRALQRVEEILRESPDDFDALMVKGNILDLDEKYEEALQCYRRVLDRDPDNVAALIDMGDSYSYLELFDRALSFYNRALDLLRQGRFYVDPREERKSAYLGKLSALRESGNVEEAKACQDQIETLFPELRS